MLRDELAVIRACQRLEASSEGRPSLFCKAAVEMGLVPLLSPVCSSLFMSIKFFAAPASIGMPLITSFGVRTYLRVGQSYRVDASGSRAQRVVGPRGIWCLESWRSPSRIRLIGYIMVAGGPRLPSGLTVEG